MKYNKSRPSGVDKDRLVYEFSLSKEEIEILLKIMTNTLDNTPKIFEIMQYRGRLRSIVTTLGRFWAEEIKKSTLSSKGSRFYKSLKKNI